MPERSKVRQLPEEVRRELDRRLADSAFSHYEALAEWLIEQGFEISKSSLHRYGRKLEKQLEELSLAREEAQAIVEACPDDENSIELATTKLAAYKLYKVVDSLDDSATEGMDVAKAARAIADLNRSSISLQRFRREVKQRTKEAAKEVDKQAKAGGLSEQAAEAIKARILGITEE